MSSQVVQAIPGAQYTSMKPIIPEDIEINSPIYSIIAMLLTLAYPIVAMYHLRRLAAAATATATADTITITATATAKNDDANIIKRRQQYKNFIKGAQLGAICAFLVQDFFCSVLVALHGNGYYNDYYNFDNNNMNDAPIIAMSDGTLEQRSSIVAYNPGWTSILLPTIMLLTIPLIKNSIWLGIISASMIQQCLRLLLVISLTPPIDVAEPKTAMSLLGVGDFFRTELLLGAFCIPFILYFIVQHYHAVDDQDDDDENDENDNTHNTDEDNDHHQEDENEQVQDMELGKNQDSLTKPLLAETY